MKRRQMLKAGIGALAAEALGASMASGRTTAGSDAGGKAAESAHWTAASDVVWTTPSKDAKGSMPLGNGEVGINLWVEAGGDIVFLISRSDSFSELSRLMKVGRVRVSLSPNPFVSGAPFRQTLRLRDGVCEIVVGGVTVSVFVDADQPVVHVVGRSATPVTVTAHAENWRTEAHTLANGEEQNSAWHMQGAPFPLVESADIFPAVAPGVVAWYHRNEDSTAFSASMKVQSLESVADKVHDPVLHRTFGGLLTAAGFTDAGDRSLKSAAVQSFAVRIAAPCFQAATAQEWIDAAQKAAAASANADVAQKRTAEWWQAYWNRSWVVVGDNSGADAPAVNRGYALQRYVQACGGRGTYPIKFNGGMFTVEPYADGRLDPDWRRWGETHWYQNVRHMYHPMLAGGDFEMMDPFFHLYENVRPLAEARTKLYHGVEGAYFPETMTVWGTYANSDYGWNREGKEPSDVQSHWWRFAWNQGPELVALLLDRWDYTHDKPFLRAHVLPMAVSVLQYFDTRFKKDASGRVRLDPTQSVETLWTGVVNDMPSSAGLNAITARLCALPADLTTPEQRAFFARMKAAAPEVPIENADVNGKMVRTLAPAREYDTKRSNCENPEMYAVWPFRLYGVGLPDLEIAKTAYARRVNHLDVGWGYDGNCAATLGLADEAMRILKVKCANSNADYRWPATWGPNFDWLPDQNHGGNLLMTAQLMLLQSDGKQIHLLPAWPTDWDVHFKLHAPQETVVECVYRSGKIERLTVTPKSRESDIVLPTTRKA